jgi:hypothetical protein
MRCKRSSVCPDQCDGGYASRQSEYILTPREFASTEVRLTSRRARRCTYCGCVYTPSEPHVVIGYKDEAPVGVVSWVPKQRALA